MKSSEAARLTGKSLAALVAGFLVLILVTSMWIFGWGFFQRSTADYRGGTDATEQVQADGGYRIAKYEWFFDQCAAVQTKEGEIETAQAELDTKPDEDRAKQLNSNITALRNKRIELINEYNTESAKADTAANFKSSDLPFRLDKEDEETTCTA